GSATVLSAGSAQSAASSPRDRSEAGKTPAKLSSFPLFSLARARLSMAILVTRPRERRASRCPDSWNTKKFRLGKEVATPAKTELVRLSLRLHSGGVGTCGVEVFGDADTLDSAHGRLTFIFYPFIFYLLSLSDAMSITKR